MLIKPIASVTYKLPLTADLNFVSRLKLFFQALFSPLIIYFLKEFFSTKVFLSRHHVTSWVRDSYYTAALYFHPFLKRLADESDDDTVWYFFWARHSALMIPFLKNRRFKVATRLHGFDLYLEQNYGYIPYQRQVLYKSDLLLPCSNHGLKYLEETLGIDNDTFLARLGAPPQFAIRRSQDIIAQNHIPNNVLKIVTCSPAVPVKRLLLLAESLEHIRFQTLWMHIGDGNELMSLKAFCERFNHSHITTIFKGYLFQEEIPAIYESEQFNVFVNVSESEGVPVSIMEAFAAGIPVIATNVGGTSEIVNKDNGVLLEPNITSLQLAEALKEFNALPESTRQAMQTNARQTYLQKCDAVKNSETLVKRLEALVAKCDS